MRALLLPVALLLIGNADPQAIPAEIQSMLDAAMASGNDGEVATIAKYATSAAPDSAQAITDAVDRWRGERSAENNRRLREADLLELWKGRAELGGYISTGNSPTRGLTAVMDLSREALRTRLKTHLQMDYQETAGITTREHYLAAIEPNYRVDDRLYVYGAAQYESDRFLGYENRYSASAGLGYSAIRKSAVTLDVELGPAFRATDFTDTTDEQSIAARGNLDLDIKLTKGLSFRQDASVYAQRTNSTVTGTSALSARLLGPLSAQLSYAFQYESMPPEGRRTTDTTSRASIIYEF